MELPFAIQDITADWLNGVLHETGHLKDEKIVSLVTEPIGVGEGFTGDIARLHVSYDRSSQHLPRTLIAKLPTSKEPMRTVTSRRRIFEKEIRFYTQIAPKSPIRTPIVYYGGIDNEHNRYALLMEDCSKYPLIDADQTGLDFEKLKVVASTIADFHARWWHDAAPAELAWVQKVKDFISDPHWDEQYRMRWELCTRLEDFTTALPNGALEIGNTIVDRWNRLGGDYPGDKLTISHSDFKADNIFLDISTPENPVVIFDWASITVGRGVADVARLLASSVETEIRRRVEKDVVSLYHDRLLKRGIAGYSFHECWQDYLSSLLIHSYFPILAFALNDTTSARSKLHARQSAHRWFSAIIDNDAVSLLP